MKTPEEFLMHISNNDGKSTVYYKPVEYLNETKALSFDKALNMLNADIDEMKKFLSAYGITEEEKAIQSAYDIWKKHIAC